MKRICFITDGYTSETREANAFVETLVNEMFDTGIECVVIAPQSITKSFISKDRLEKRKELEQHQMENLSLCTAQSIFLLQLQKMGALIQRILH